MSAIYLPIMMQSVTKIIIGEIINKIIFSKVLSCLVTILKVYPNPIKYIVTIKINSIIAVIVIVGMFVI